MHKLKVIICRYMQMITFFSLTIILIIVTCMLIKIEEKQAYEMSIRTFSQIEQVSVMNVTEKNDLSYIFSLFAVSSEANYYAIDTKTGEIVGSTVSEHIGEKATEIGLNFSDIETRKHGFTAYVNGQKSYCVFKKTGDNYLGRIILCSELYRQIPTFVVMLTGCLAVIALILSFAATNYMNKYVVEKIQEINEKLHSIAHGNQDETIDVHGSFEFSELSKYLNIMIKSLLDNNKKMSYILSKANRYIGVYEYNNYMKKVRFTGYVPMILSLDTDEVKRLSSDYSLFKEFIDSIRANPVPNETSVFRLCGQSEQYVRLEELNEQDKIFGIVIDVTDEIMRKRMLEYERDIDLLTGLYNRRGLDNQLTALFQNPEELGHSAFIMLDADGLKEINDTYGHEKGDIYLKEIASIIDNFGSNGSVAARQSGDEFILFLYQYSNEEELLSTIDALRYIQDHSSVYLDDNISTQLRFSLGYSITKPDAAYAELIKEADKKMYENKRERKKNCIAECDSHL